MPNTGLRMIHVCCMVTMCSLAGCDREDGPIGVLVNELAVTKTPIGPASPDVSSTGLLPNSLVRVRRGDVMGNEAIDTIVESDDHRGVEVRDGAGAGVVRIPTSAYLSDFTVVPDPAASRKNVLLYMYPDEHGGSTFTVVRLPERRAIATWREDTGGNGHVDVGRWGEQAAVFYIQSGAIVVRSVGGQLLARLSVPGIGTYSFLYVSAFAAGHSIFVASGNGYVHFHMVVIVDQDGRVRFQERAAEQAFRLNLQGNPSQFDVETRSTIWRYTVGR
jgi:hypothetical protein